MTRAAPPATGQGDRPTVVRETHSRLVMLVGDCAYKVKKPVDLGFLDFTTEPARRAACLRGVELNRRLAPEALARETRSRLVRIECTAPVELAATRAQHRFAQDGDASEADAAVTRALAAGREP